MPDAHSMPLIFRPGSALALYTWAHSSVVLLISTAILYNKTSPFFPNVYPSVLASRACAADHSASNDDSHSERLAGVPRRYHRSALLYLQLACQQITAVE